MKIGKCKLCLADGVELQDSHFLPKGVYRILRDDGAPNPHPWIISERKTAQISFQLKAHLLCRDCEQRLSKQGEKWVLENCLKKDRSFPLATVLAARPPEVFSSTNPTRVYFADKVHEIDCSALAYFAASMFPRGSIHGWSEDGAIPVKLGPFQESFRAYLMGLADFPVDCALLVTVREGKEIDRLTHAPVGERREFCHIYKFPMPGLAFSLAVGKNIPENYRNSCFVHMPGNPIMVTPILEQWLKRDANQLLQMHFDRKSQRQ
jgi:hypothetical protein